MGKRARLADWTARIIVRDREGIIAVFEGIQAHLPGGKREPGDTTPLHTAKRELQEETGLPKNRGDFKFLYIRPSRHGRKSRYDTYYFEAVFAQKTIDGHLQAHGQEGEVTRKISYAEFRRGTNFNSAHLHVLRKFKRLRPPNMQSKSRQHT